MNYPRTSLTPDSGWKSNICKRLPAYVSLHNFSLTSASPKCTSDYLSLFGNESLIQTSTPHLCDRIPHYNQRRTSGSTKKISQFHLPFRVRSHTIGTPITSARRTPPHSSCNDRSSLLTHTFCRSESLSEISCLDQESPITNQILAWSASHHLDKVKPKCLACSSIHSSSVSPSEISDHTCIESYDDLLSSGTFNMYQTPSNSDMTESHDQLMSPDQHLEPLSGCALQLKPFTSKTSSSNLLNVTQGNATSSSSISSSPNDRSSSIKNSANMEQIISIGSNHSNQSENEDEAGVTSSSSESLDVLHNQRIMIRSLLRFAVQVFIPLSICGFGNMAAGLLLDRVQQLRVFDVLSELYIAIPCLMGLKGNLEMTMASRLSTAANLQQLRTFDQIVSVTKGNLCLLQVQATIVSLIASFISVLVYSRNTYTFDVNHVLVLIASNVLTANIACTFLSVIMILIIIVCNRTNIDPDNVATPIASSLGDVTTVALIAWLASALFDQVEQQRAYVNVLAIVLLVLMTPVCACIAHHNHNTRQVLRHGWWPILVSMILSSLAGMILDKAVALFVGFALVQPLINGVGGNLAAIQASRISTFLHRTMTDREFVQKTCRTKQMLNQQQVRLRENPKQEQIYVELFDSIENDDILPNAECKTIEISGGSIIADITSSTGVNPSLSLGGHRRRRRTLTREASVRMSERDFRQILLDSQCAKVLLLIALPLHVLYYFTIVAYKGSYSFDNQAYFLPVYLLVALVQMITLLHCARSLVYWMWDKKINPDDCSIPVLTAFGDLIGTSLLAIGFVLLNPTRFF